MKIRVLVNGAQGKMGQITVKTIMAHADFILAGAIGHKDDLASEIKKSRAEVVIDFTNAASILRNIETIINCHVHPVIGTTGILKEQIKPFVKRSAKLKLGGIIAPNFSLGGVLMMKMAEEAVKYFPDVEIIEMHHRSKLDSPSGTSIRTAEKIAKARHAQKKAPKPHETIKGARGASYQGIPIHAIRLPGVLAHQQIIFGGTGETLTIRHDSIDRQCFMPGVLLACKKVMELSELVYGLEEIL